MAITTSEPPHVDYTTLCLVEVRTTLDDVGRDAEATFSRLNARQLNWRPDATRWSIAQCFEHLLKANRLMMSAAEAALKAGRSPSIWERLPVLPGVVGPMLIRSQTPDSTRKFTAPAPARPTSSDIAADVIRRFVEQHRDIAASLQDLDERVASQTVMTSPFIRVITYSILDGCRLMAVHDRRHVEQARRVMLAPAFPGV
jgi:hypothetical protein